MGVWASKWNRLFAALCLVLWQSCLAAPGENPMADAFDYFANNWNVVGLKDYPRGARVTPDNRIFLAGSNTTVQVRFGRNLTPLSRAQTKLAREGWMPILEITADDGPVRYEFTYWATPLPTVRDWKKAFDWPASWWWAITATSGTMASRSRVRSTVRNGTCWLTGATTKRPPPRRATTASSSRFRSAISAWS
jgi:hypothetical protein